MAKLPPIFLLLALVTVGLASAARTTITTIAVEADGLGTACREKMRPCLKYKMTMSKGPTNSMAEKLLRICCTQLKSMDEHCMHRTLQMMAMKMVQSDEGTIQDMEKIGLQEPKGANKLGGWGFAGTGFDGFGPKLSKLGGWGFSGIDGFGPKLRPSKLSSWGFGGIDGFGPKQKELDKPIYKSV